MDPDIDPPEYVRPGPLAPETNSVPDMTVSPPKTAAPLSSEDFFSSELLLPET